MNGARPIDPDAPPRVLEEQIDAKRADINRTLNQIEDRFNPNQVVDYLRDNSAELAAGLLDSAKRNPVPMLLTGVGLVWLMSSQTGGSRDNRLPHYRSSRYDGSRMEDDDDGFDLSIEREDEDRNMQAYVITRSVYRDRPSREGAADGGDDDGIADSMQEGLASLQDSMGDLRDDARAHYDRMSRSARERYDAMSDDARDRYDRARDEARRRYARLRRTTRDRARTARQQARDAGERSHRFMREQPLVSGAAGIAIGALIGSLLPPSRTEDRYLGEQADRTRERAQDSAAEQASRLGAKATDALAKASERTEDALEEARRAGENELERADAKAKEQVREADRQVGERVGTD